MSRDVMLDLKALSSHCPACLAPARSMCVEFLSTQNGYTRHLIREPVPGVRGPVQLSGCEE